MMTPWQHDLQQQQHNDNDKEKDDDTTTLWLRFGSLLPNRDRTLAQATSIHQSGADCQSNRQAHSRWCE